MSLIVFSNNASSLSAAGIINSDTQVTVQAGQGALFPSISAGHYAVCTLEDVSGNIEVVYVTAITTDTLTITRAQEGTSARAFPSGSRVELRVTAGVLAALLQKGGGDTLAGTTNLTGILALGGGGSIQGGEFTGALRGVPGQTSNQVLIPSSGPATSGGSPILTTANLLANLPSGSSAVLTNMVLAWAGSSGSVPSGWHICDGTNGTPDLRDLFILGAGGSLPTSGGSSTTVTNSSSAGSVTDSYVLQIADIPAHTHAYGGFSNILGYSPGSGTAAIIYDASKSLTSGSTGGGGGHTHGLTGTAHTHTYQMPPYRALFWIMKL